jgi:hypothetical protein
MLSRWSRLSELFLRFKRVQPSLKKAGVDPDEAQTHREIVLPDYIRFRLDNLAVYAGKPGPHCDHSFDRGRSEPSKRKSKWPGYLRMMISTLRFFCRPAGSSDPSGLVFDVMGFLAPKPWVSNETLRRFSLLTNQDFTDAARRSEHGAVVLTRGQLRT